LRSVNSFVARHYNAWMKLALLGGDEDSLELVRWAVAKGGHELVAVYEAGKCEAELRAIAPRFQRFYNANSPPPYPLPENKSRGSIQTATTPGGGSTNEFRMDDTKGKEEMFFNASKDMSVEVKNNADRMWALGDPPAPLVADVELNGNTTLRTRARGVLPLALAAGQTTTIQLVLFEDPPAGTDRATITLEGIGPIPVSPDFIWADR
jgi:hypothetical protein